MDQTQRAQFEESMFSSFEGMTREEKLRLLILGSNAVYLLRHSHGVESDTEVGKTINAFRGTLLTLIEQEEAAIIANV